MIMLRGLRKTYPDGTVAVKSLDLDVQRGELVALVGPSGCGKSTTLRLVNRLIEPTSGTITINGDDVTTVNAVTLRRTIGYVIQKIGLLPHLKVAANVAVVPKLLGWKKKDITKRVDEVLTLVGLDPDTYRDRYPSELSGGQQQRVGVARALAARPPVMLMDEPFGAVDPLARDKIQTEFRALQQKLGTTVLFVTHDLDEAVRLADRIAVLSTEGELQQYAPPATLLRDPANDFVANFVGADRSLRRLTVTPIDTHKLVKPSADQIKTASQSTARVDLPATLHDGLAAAVDSPNGWAPIFDNDELVGLLTPQAVFYTLHASS